MKKSILFVIVLSLIMTSCKNEPQKATSTEATVAKDTTAVVEETSFSKDNLVGDWIIDDEYKAGFKLKADGTAESINMATLPYSKWELSGDLLQLHGLSIGNGNGKGDPIIDSLYISSLTPKELKVKMGSKDAPETIYVKK
nr:lipocalin family protein [uncultured Flavobacterium sp.]